MSNLPRKLYQRIAEEIAAAIVAGRYPLGTRLPGERDLAEEFSVSRPTIREAMIALEIRGLIEARQGSGLYVTHAPAAAERAPELDVGAFELVEARTLCERSPLCVHMFGQARREGVMPRVNEHKLILDALRSRDPRAARGAMRAHLQRVTGDLLAATELELVQRARAEADAHRSRIARRAGL